jgi:hypothetical protein
MCRRALLLSLFALAFLAACAAPAVGGTKVGVNFVGSHTTAMGPGETAGVFPQAFWNNAAGSGGPAAAMTLLDDAGLATGLTLQWRGWASYTGMPDTAGDGRLMRGTLKPFPGEAVTVTVSGLDAFLGGAMYDIVVYFDGPNTADWATAFTVAGQTLTGHDPAGVHFGGTFVEDTGAGGNWVRFSHISGDSFTLTAAPLPDGVSVGSLNALQIIHAPEPATLALLAAGLAIALRRRR